MSLNLENRLPLRTAEEQKVSLWLSLDAGSVSQRNGTGLWEALLRWTGFIIVFVKTVAKRTGLSETDLGSHHGLDMRP